MPEGPELRINSIFVNNVCSGLLFAGRPIKSSVSKCCDVDWESPKYTISSECRGKEVALTLRCQEKKNKSMRILFRFGMSGKFTLTGADDIPKHAHLQFKTVPSDKQKETNVLSFVDVRRFGSWHVRDGWGEERGPDIVAEYDLFRANVLDNLKENVFNKPICEAMLNQKYFNGIGNYLRAEVLFRAKIPPFTCARTVLEGLTGEVVAATPLEDVLSLCRDVSKEVIELKTGLGKAEKMTTNVSKLDHAAFLDWLQCYNNPSMNILKDKSGRSIWFHGPPGPMAPKDGAKRRVSKRKHVPDNPNPTTSSSVLESGDEDKEDVVKKQKIEKTVAEMNTKPLRKTKKPEVKQEHNTEVEAQDRDTKKPKILSNKKTVYSVRVKKDPIPSPTSRRSTRLREKQSSNK